MAADIQSALSRCRQKGGAFQRIAEERLSALHSLVSVTAGELKKAKEAALPLALRVHEIHRNAGARVRELFQSLQAAMGNPAVDIASALLFPGGTEFYVDCPPGEQSDRIELLSQLLEAGMLARLPEDQTPLFAKKAREIAGEMRGAAEALRIPRARVSLLERSLGLVVQLARGELLHLRKRLVAEGLDAGEVEEMFSGMKAPERVA